MKQYSRECADTVVNESVINETRCDERLAFANLEVAAAEDALEHAMVSLLCSYPMPLTPRIAQHM